MNSVDKQLEIIYAWLLSQKVFFKKIYTTASYEDFEEILLLSLEIVGSLSVRFDLMKTQVEKEKEKFNEIVVIKDNKIYKLEDEITSLEKEVKELIDEVIFLTKENSNYEDRVESLQEELNNLIAGEDM